MHSPCLVDFTPQPKLLRALKPEPAERQVSEALRLRSPKLHRDRQGRLSFFPLSEDEYECEYENEDEFGMAVQRINGLNGSNGFKE